MDNFNIISPTNKKYLKLEGEPNLSKLKIQDGDMFRRRDDLLTILYSTTRNKKYTYTLSIGSYYSLKLTSVLDNYESSSLKLENRYGILYPRYSDYEIKTFSCKLGYPSIHSSVLSATETSGIRKECKVKINEEDVEIVPSIN